MPAKELIVDGVVLDEKALRAERKKALLAKFAEGKRLTPEELAEAGLKRRESSVKKTDALGDIRNYPKMVGGLAAIARLIADHFNVYCTRQYVFDWRNGKRLAKGVPPFPAPTDGNRFEVAECLQWYAEHMPKKVSGDDDIDEKVEREKKLNQLDEIEHERFLRQEQRGKYIDRNIARRTCIGVLRKYHGMVKATLERGEAELRNEWLRGATTGKELTANEVIALVQEYDLKRGLELIDVIEEKCEQFGKEIKV